MWQNLQKLPVLAKPAACLQLSIELDASRVPAGKGEQRGTGPIKGSGTGQVSAEPGVDTSKAGSVGWGEIKQSNQ